MTFAVVELDPNTAVELHQHPNEQMGVVLSGSLRFTVGAEERELRPGDTYAIPGGVPHQAVSGRAALSWLTCFRLSARTAAVLARGSAAVQLALIRPTRSAVAPTPGLPPVLPARWRAVPLKW
jgi:uncharacterized RmlC-like cupin family protein